MPNIKLDRLLFVSSFFERKAQALLKKAGSFYPFSFRAISDLLGTNIPHEQLLSWVKKNRSVLENIKGNDWRLVQEAGNLYLRTFENWDYSGPRDIGIFSFIGKTSTPPKSIDASEISLLQNDGPIPNLWFFRGPEEGANIALQTTPETAHENWLITALSSLLSKMPDGSFLNDVADFIKENKVTIDKIRRHFAVSNPQVLGQGADGVALAISPSLVLKIFRSEGSLKHALRAMERLHKNPDLAKTEAMIYDAGKLGELNRYSIYYYIIERMKPVDKMSSTVYSALARVIDDFRGGAYSKIDVGKYKRLLKDPKNLPEVKMAIKEAAQILARDVKSRLGDRVKMIEQELDGKIKSDWLESLAEEIIVKYLTGRTDLHMGNIGFTGYGHFRYYDPVYGAGDLS
jgi:hypothetical protein